MKKIFKKKIVIFLIVIIMLISGGVFAALRKNNGAEYTTAKVERGKLVQTVSETGMIKAAEEIDLNFLLNGRINKILVKVGDVVEKDTPLAELDYRALLIKEREAEATLSKVISGSTREDVAVAQASVSQAESSYNSAVSDLDKIKKKTVEDLKQAETTLNNLLSTSPLNVTSYEQAVFSAETTLANAKNTYQKSIDNYKSSLLVTMEDKLAVSNTALDAIDRVLKDEDAKNLLSVQDTSYLNNTKLTYSDGVDLLSAAKISLSSAKLSQTEDSINTAVDKSLIALNKVFSSLNYCFGALERSAISVAFTQIELDAFKTSVSTNLTAVSTGISAVQTAKNNLDSAFVSYNVNVSNAQESLSQAKANLNDAILSARNNLSSLKLSNDQQLSSAQSRVNSAKEALDLAKTQLAKIKAPARNEDIILAQASLDSVRKQIEDSIIKAPIKGTITKINYEIGEQPVAGKPVISILGENNFEIEVDISEADIAKVRIEDVVEITFDAFGDDIKFAGNVYFIEPAETIIQDVIYYKVKIKFLDNRGEEGRNGFIGVKSGMTANATIITEEKENVLIIPSRAIIERNGSGKFVRVLVNNEVLEKSVKTGLKGDEGMTEIISGVEEGEDIVTFIKEKK